MHHLFIFWRAFNVQITWSMIGAVQLRNWLLIAVVVHVVVGVFSGQQLLALSTATDLSAQLPHVGDAFFLAFAGPSFGQSNWTPLLTWLLRHIFFCMLVGSISTSQLSNHDYLVILMLGSRWMWWVSLVFSIMIIAFSYTIIILCATLVGIVPWLRWHPDLSSFFIEQGIWQAAAGMSLIHLFSIIFSLTASSLVMTGLFQILITFTTHRVIWGIVAVMSLALIVWIIGLGDHTARWQPWIPGTQSILSRHWPFEPRMPGLTVRMSLVYNIMLTIWLVLIGHRIVKRFDFIGSQNNE